MIIYSVNPKRSTKKLLECLSEFGKIVWYKVNVQKKKKSAALLCNWKNVNWSKMAIYNNIKKYPWNA